VHHWRQRKEHPGQLVQFDGSYEFWFEDRGPNMCLLAAIDDATGNILWAEFAENEGVEAVFSFWKGYLEHRGKPRAIYLDKFSTYKQNLGTADPDMKTQFGRALHQLGIEPIFANSPQAKGRVERLFKTLQDRLIKELRLQNISTPEKANQFLKEVFVPDFNRKFSVQAYSPVDLHRPLRTEEQKQLEAIFARQEERIVRNDYTVSFRNAWYQLLPTPRIIVRPKDTILVEERLDGSIHFRIRNTYLSFELLPNRPQRQSTAAWVLGRLPEKARISWKPAADHPWKKLPLNFSAAR
jgi:transposase-like protein